MDARETPSEILLLHDGELGDVRALFDELGVPSVERLGTLQEGDRKASWRLVVASARQALRLELDPGLEAAHCIAILNQRSGPLRTLLRRWDVDFIVQRPVHPMALRLLILHCLYLGPERRRSRRVSIGAPIRFRSSFLNRSGILADLSESGCLLLSYHAPSLHQRLRVVLPAGLAGRERLSVRGQVVRVRPADGDGSGTQAISISFDRRASTVQTRLQGVVESFAMGPASLPKQVLLTSPEGPSPGEVHAALEIGERCSEPGRAYPHCVSALAQEAARVLIGREVSMGGMRVDAGSHVQLGVDVKVALHAGSEEIPVVMRARVVRDDGERGVVLRFAESRGAERRRLLEIIEQLPYQTTTGDPEETGVVISQLMEPERKPQEI